MSLATKRRLVASSAGFTPVCGVFVRVGTRLSSGPLPTKGSRERISSVIELRPRF